MYIFYLLRDRLQDCLWDRLRDHLQDRLRDRLRDCLRDRLRDRLQNSLRDLLRDLLRNTLRIGPDLVKVSRKYHELKAKEQLALNCMWHYRMNF